MTNIDPTEYYDDDDDFMSAKKYSQPQSQEPVQTQMNPVAQEPDAMQDPEGAVQPAMGIQGQPANAQSPVQTQVQPNIEQPVSVQGQPLAPEMEFIPGMTVSIKGDNNEDRTGEILASNPTNNLVVLKMTDNEELIEIQESLVTIIPNKIIESEQSLKNMVTNLITETKKRKASENKDPHFVQFLTEKNKKSWYNLSVEDKEKVVFSINESKDQIYSENQLLDAIKEALTVKKSFEDTLIECMPSSLKPLWSKLDEKYKNSILSSAKLYPHLNTESQMEKFWESRNIESYSQINESKQILSNNNVVDNTKLSDDQIDKFISKIKNL